MTHDSFAVFIFWGEFDDDIITICPLCHTVLNDPTYLDRGDYIEENCELWCEHCKEAVFFCISADEWKKLEIGEPIACAEKMTVEELDAYCKEHNIDVSKIKDEAIRPNSEEVGPCSQMQSIWCRWIFKVGLLQTTYIIPYNQVDSFLYYPRFQYKTLEDIEIDVDDDDNSKDSYTKEEVEKYLGPNFDYGQGVYKSIVKKSIQYINAHFNVDDVTREKYCLGHNVNYIKCEGEIPYDTRHDGVDMWYAGTCAKCKRESIGWISGD